MLILNLGCGTKISASPEVVNIDWSIYLRIKRNRILRFIAPIFIRGERLRLLREMPNNILVYDLAKGIPFESNSADVIYHSHLLEHLDKEVAYAFLLEAKRVLKVGGVNRIVVPDMEYLCKRYIDNIVMSQSDDFFAKNHEYYIANIIEQCVRRESKGSNQQPPIRRRIENIILGDARKRGETHQWMYDRINLPRTLFHLGYHKVVIQEYDKSDIPEWKSFGLDCDDQGNQYKPSSLYVEATK